MSRRKSTGCAYVDCSYAAKVIGAPVAAIEELIQQQRIPWKGPTVGTWNLLRKYSKDGSVPGVRVQIPATRRKLIEMTEDALRRLDQPMEFKRVGGRWHAVP